MRNKALLIGINDYPAGNELHGCIEDINAVKNAIERNGDGSINFDVKTLTDVQSSQEAMESIRALFSDGSDMAFLYFSGHGYANDTDAELVFPQDIQGQGYYTGLKMSDILKVACRSRIRNKVLVLDCCHSGHLGNIGSFDSSTATLGSGISILTACREDESAMECGGHGLFTEQFCNALNGGAADFSGNITIGGIYAYIDRSFGQWMQRPTFKTNVTEFAPLKRVAPKVSLSTIKELVTLFPEAQTVFPLDPSFEFTNTLEQVHEVIRPYADKTNVSKFKVLQKLQSIGFVEPIGEQFMYFAAMKSTGCRLTTLGQYYWRLVKDGRI